MNKVAVLFMGLSLVVFAGCSMGKKEDPVIDTPTPATAETGTTNTSTSITPHTEDKAIQESFEVIENIIKEEESKQ